MATSQGPIGGKWYTCLKKKEVTNDKWKGRALFSTISRDQACKYFLIYSIYRGYRRYAAFISSVDFYIWYRQILSRNEPPEIHEIILGEKSQCARFDIDLTLKNLPSGQRLKEYGDNLRNLLLFAIQETLADFDIELNISKDVLICVSHSQDLIQGNEPNQDSKYSCHLILNKYHYNYEEAAEFYRLVVAKNNILSEAEKLGILDKGIYKSCTSFRLIGSTKDDRVKTYLKEIRIGDATISFDSPTNAKEELMLFRKSAISDIQNCEHIPIIVPIKENKHASVVLPVGTSDEAVKLLETAEKESCPFVFDSVEGGLVLLRRTSASYCRLCDRIHDSDNPFLRITPGGNVYFHCRRAVKKKFYFIGSLELNSPDNSAHSPVNSADSPVNSSIESIEMTTVKKESPTPSFSVITGCDFNRLRDLSKQFAPQNGVPQYNM
jgi:hypothetical protein